MAVKEITVKEIIKRNPNISEKTLKESMEISDELRSHGISRRGYGLVPTFSGKKATAVDGKEDKRAMHLTRS